MISTSYKGPVMECGVSQWYSTLAVHPLSTGPPLTTKMDKDQDVCFFSDGQHLQINVMNIERWLF